MVCVNHVSHITQLVCPIVPSTLGLVGFPTSTTLLLDHHVHCQPWRLKQVSPPPFHTRIGRPASISSCCLSLLSLSRYNGSHLSPRMLPSRSKRATLCWEPSGSSPAGATSTRTPSPVPPRVISAYILASTNSLGCRESKDVRPSSTPKT